ncbi:MAG: hypothetical protein ACT4PT_03215, partial [Methanobacteriota archaeon]
MLICPACNASVPVVPGLRPVCPACATEAGPDGPAFRVASTAAAERAFRLYGRHGKAILLFWAVPGLIASVISLFLALLETQGVVELSVPDGPTFVALLSLGLLTIVVFLAFGGGLMAMADEAYRTGRTSAGTGFATMRSAGPRLVATAFLFGVFLLAGFPLFLLPSLAVLHYFPFAVPEAAISGRGAVDAMRESMRYVRSHRTFRFTLVLLFLILFVASVNFAAALVSVAVAEAAGVAVAPEPSGPALFASQAAGSLAIYLATPVPANANAGHHSAARAAAGPAPERHSPEWKR